MPCNADYMNPTIPEKNASEMYCFLDELDGKPFNANHFSGYHPSAYQHCCTQDALDNLASTLCRRLQKCEDVTKYSLELQIWWRDHQVADKIRVNREFEEKKHAKERKAAIAKLTPYERKLLGLKK